MASEGIPVTTPSCAVAKANTMNERGSRLSPRLYHSLFLLKFDKIWPFLDFSGADQRGPFLRKRAAWVRWWCPEVH
jgi:hypothetical protein